MSDPYPYPRSAQRSHGYYWNVDTLTWEKWTGSTGGTGGAGDASAANQVTGNASLSSIDGKLTNQATAAKQDLLLAELQGKADLTETQPVSLASIPINAAASTAAIQATQQTTLDAIKAKTDNLPPLGQALAAASTPVILPAATIATLTPPAAITGFATSAIQTTQQTALDAIQARAALLLADATFTGRINTQGQKTSAASTPVVLPTDALPPPDRMATGDITTIATSQSITTYGSGTTRVTIIGTWTGTLSFYGFDGTTAIARKGENASTGALESSTTANGTWMVPTAGFAALVVLGPTSTGTASITLDAGVVSNTVSLTQPLPTGTNSIGAVTVAALSVTQGAAASSVTGPLVQALVSDAPETYLDATVRPLSLTPQGRLRVAAVTADAEQIWQHTFDNPWSMDYPATTGAMSYV